IDVPLERQIKGTHGARATPMRPCFARLSSAFASAVQSFALWNRRIGYRRDAADLRYAGRKRRSRDEELITLGCCRTAGHASTRKGIDVGKRCCETVRECLHEDHEQVLLPIRQAEITDRHVEVVRDLGHGPAVYFFSRSCRAVSGSDVKLKNIACIVEMYELLQALDVTIVKELLLE